MSWSQPPASSGHGQAAALPRPQCPPTMGVNPCVWGPPSSDSLIREGPGLSGRARSEPSLLLPRLPGKEPGHPAWGHHPAGPLLQEQVHQTDLPGRRRHGEAWGCGLGGGLQGGQGPHPRANSCGPAPGGACRTPSGLLVLIEGCYGPWEQPGLGSPWRSTQEQVRPPDVGRVWHPDPGTEGKCAPLPFLISRGGIPAPLLLFWFTCNPVPVARREGGALGCAGFSPGLLPTTWPSPHSRCGSPCSFSVGTHRALSASQQLRPR